MEKQTSSVTLEWNALTQTFQCLFIFFQVLRRQKYFLQSNVFTGEAATEQLTVLQGVTGSCRSLSNNFCVLSTTVPRPEQALQHAPSGVGLITPRLRWGYDRARCAPHPTRTQALSSWRVFEPGQDQEI